MSRKAVHRKIGISGIWILAAATLFFAAVAAAQTAGAPAGKYETMDAAALRCWWKTDKASVRVGEGFTLTLTCRLAESASEKAVLNDALLEPGALVLSPYQVKAGTRFKDIVRVLPGPDGPVTFRNVQYSYTVKLIGEEFFGKDIPLPPLEIRYHLDRLSNRGIVTPGKERTLILPPLPIRIQSLAPRTASAIRDVGNETFQDIERHRLKALIAFVVAGILFLLPLLLLLPVLIRAFRNRPEELSNGAAFRKGDLLKRLERELGRIERHSRTASWDDASKASLLAVFRVICALALSRQIVKTTVAAGTRGLEGQLAFSKGLWPRTRILVSVSLTPEEMAASLNRPDRLDSLSAQRKALLDEARQVFAAMNNVCYAMSGNDADRTVFDGALKTGSKLLSELRRDRGAAVRLLRKVKGAIRRG
jgi:hypothetical protein